MSSKKGKKGNKKQEEGPPPQELIRLAEQMGSAMQRKILLHNLDSGIAVSSEKELLAQIGVLEGEISAEEESFARLITDMTRCYKASQDSLVVRVNELNHTISDLRDQLELSRVSLEETKRTKDSLIETKEKEIVELKIKMEQMANEFGDMLKEVLDKMSERIEVNNTEWEKDGPPIIKKLEDFMIGSQAA